MNYFLNNPIPTAAEVMRKFADGGEVDYGDYGESLMDLASVYGLRPTLEDRFVAASTPSPAPTITTSSGMTYYRWSDGTYNRNPESTGIRTPYDQLPPEYQAQDSRRSQQAAESGRETTMPTGEAAPLSTIPSIPDETGYRTEFINPPPDFSGIDAGLVPEAPPFDPMRGVSFGDDREGIMPTGQDEILTPPPAPALSSFDAGQKAMALASLIDPTLIKGIGVGDAAFGGAGTSGAAVPDYFRAVAPDTVGGQGALYEEGALEAVKKAAVDPTQGLFKSGFEALAGEPGIAEAIQAKSERDLGALAKVESDYDVMKPISDLLKANKFEQAFEVAKEKGVVDKMMTPGWLEQLRQPFTPEEMKAFYKAIPPDYRGSEYSFNPDAAPVSETGYPEPLSAFQSKDKLTAIDAIIRLGGAAVLGAGALSALGGAGAAGAGAAGAGGAGAAGTSGGVLSSLKAAATKILGIPEVIGTKVGEALGASTLNSLQAKMIGNAIISGGVTGAKGGDLEDILKSAALAAGLTYVSDKAIKAVTGSLSKSGVLDSVSEIPGGDVTAVDPSVASNVADKITQGLDKVTVVGSKALDLAQQVGGAGALTAAQAATQPGAPKQPTTAEQPSAEREFKIATEGDKLALGDVASPLAIAGGAAGTQEPFVPQETVEGMQQFEQIAGREPDFGAGLETGLYTGRRGLSAEEPFVPQETVRGMQEFKQTASPEQLDASNLAIQAIMNQLPFEAAPIDPLTGLQEIVSTTAPAKLDLTDPLIQTLVNRYIDVKPPEPVADDMEEFKIETDRDLSPGYLQFAPPIFTPIDPTQIAKGYVPTQVKTPLQEIVSKYGTLENLIRAAGMLSGVASTATPSTGGAGAGAGAGYDPRLGAGRGQWIDWEKVKADAAAAGMNLNTYVARNWNKIQNRALEAGMQSGVMPGAVPPTVPGSDTTQTPDVMVDPRSLPGGLNTMAMGGAPSRVRGPGSGRDDKIPALLSDGEYVIDAETMALLGDGSVDKAADLMDGFRENIRKHKGATLAKGGISPNAKSPLQYLRG